MYMVHEKGPFGGEAPPPVPVPPLPAVAPPLPAVLAPPALAPPPPVAVPAVTALPAVVPALLPALALPPPPVGDVVWVPAVPRLPAIPLGESAGSGELEQADTRAKTDAKAHADETRRVMRRCSVLILAYPWLPPEQRVPVGQHALVARAGPEPR